MYVFVKMLNGFQRELVYALPHELHHNQLQGQFVLVPLRNAILPALVLRQEATRSQEIADFTIREIVQLIKLPTDPLLHSFLGKIADFYFTDVLFFYEKLAFMFKTTSVGESSLIPPALPPPSIPFTLPPLTAQQQTAADYVTTTIGKNTFTPALLHGVTGSGKTEVYKKIMLRAIELGRSVMLLLPEVSLAQRFQKLLQEQLPSVTFFGYHSATLPKEKKALWNALLRGDTLVVIGVHLPVFLPMSNLGVIIVDEEHEAAFEEIHNPKINSKHAALYRAQHYKIPILLGSATPSVSTIYSAQTKGWPIFQLTQRFAGSMPSISKVLLTDKTRKRSSFWLTYDLEKAIGKCLDDGKQAIIYINRRGYGFFLQCKPCGFIFQCPSCAVGLTAHSTKKALSLRCHYCEYERKVPATCPQCKSTKPDFITKGVGTQQMVEILQKRFPFARIARADQDTTKLKSWQQTVQDFSEKKIDILVGTKTITKGYHFPHVTLVGIIWADLNLHIPLFNATETTLQQLIQVAGRAGREHAGSTVIMQIMHDHPIFNQIAEESYLDFASAELTVREETMYPPFTRLLQVELRHRKADLVDGEAAVLAAFLRDQITSSGMPATILGPAAPAVSKIARQEIRHIFIKSSSLATLTQLVTSLRLAPLKSLLFFSHQ